MKKKFKSALYSVAVLVLMTPVFVGAQFDEGIPDAGDTGTSNASVAEVIMNVMQWLLYIVGFLGVIGFAIAGIMYLTAAGDDDRIGKAKSTMLFSIIGVIVAIAGLIIVQFLGGILLPDASIPNL